jgi:hypothetical protein
LYCFTCGKLSGKLSGKGGKFIQNPDDFRLDGKFFRVVGARDGDLFVDDFDIEEY